jgi:hypothetical protein
VPDQHRQLLRHRPQPPPPRHSTTAHAASCRLNSFSSRQASLLGRNVAVLPPVEGRQGHAERARERVPPESFPSGSATNGSSRRRRAVRRCGPARISGGRSSPPSGRARTPTRSRSARSRARRVTASATSTARSASASPAGWSRCPREARAVRLVREPMPLEAPEEARLFDEALPAGLRLRG